MAEMKQECIPVGCLPSAAVAIFFAMHTPCHARPLAKHTVHRIYHPTTHAVFAMHAPLCHAPPHCGWKE